MTFVSGLIVGLLLGSMFGVFVAVAALCNVADDRD